MQENPIPAIENAELTAKQTVQKASEDKNLIIRKAQEEANRHLTEAIQKAQAESNSMIHTAEQSIRMDSSAHNSGFEKKKTDLIHKAEARESEAVNAIIEIISEKTS